MIFNDLDFEFPESSKVDGLVKKTGANVVISSKAFPFATEAMVLKHITAGALLIRVVSAQDLFDFTDEILLFGLRYMHKLGANPWQAVLLLDNQGAMLDYDKYVRKVNLWSEHGGTTVCTFGNSVRSYLVNREKDFMATIKTKTILVPQFASRKEIEVLNDWTITLATFPGVGWEGAKAIRKIINNKKLGDDLLTALWWLTDEEETKKSEGTWREVRMAARKWLNLPDAFGIDRKGNDLDITVDTKEVKE